MFSRNWQTLVLVSLVVLCGVGAWSLLTNHDDVVPGEPSAQPPSQDPSDQPSEFDSSRGLRDAARTDAREAQPQRIPVAESIVIRGLQIHQFMMGDVATFYFRNAMGSAGFTKKAGPDQTWEAIPEQCPKDVGAVRQGEVGNLINHFLTVNAASLTRRKIPQDAVGSKVEVRAGLKDGTEFVMHVHRAHSDRSTCDAVSSNHDFKFEIPVFAVSSFRDQDPKDLFRPKE